MANRMGTRSGNFAGSSSSTTADHANKRKVDEENSLIDEQTPNKKLNSSGKKQSSFPRLVRSESTSKAVSRSYALTENAVITDQHLSLTRWLHNSPITSTPLIEFQKKHEASLLDHLKGLKNLEQTLEVGLEMAALVNLLKLFNYPNDSEKQKFVIEASSGAKMMQDGLIQLKQGQDMLQEAIVQMFHPKSA